MADSSENKVINPQSLEKAVDKINTDYQQNYPKFGSEQGDTELPSPSQNTTLTDPAKIDSPKEKIYKLLVPIGSYHMEPSGKRATRSVDGKEVHFNENHVPSIGLAVKTSKNTEVFATYINKNSFSDQMVLAGVQYVPFKTNIKDVEIGGGIALGAAWTDHGSYSKQAPQISVGNFTALTSGLATAEYKPTGTGFQLNIVPTLKNVVTAFTLTQRF